MQNLDNLIIERKELKNLNLDINGRDIIIGFNEPKFKKLKNDVELDSKLNARFITYFLPAIELARKQKKRPRLIIISGVNSSLKWGIENEEERKIILANNSIKIDFLQTFFEKYFYKDISILECITSQDLLKVSENKFLDLWNIIEKKYIIETKELKFQFAKFLFPKSFNKSNYSQLTEKQKNKLENIDISNSFKYAISHLFALGDANFEGNYIHNPKGYISIGGEAEEYFNIVRSLAYKVLQEYGENFFNKKIIFFENYKIVLKNKYKVPPAYNGMFGKKEFLEVTYENEREIEFYDNEKKLKDQMEYMYENLISKEEYNFFWKNYKNRYFDLKKRYKEAYRIEGNW